MPRKFITLFLDFFHFYYWFSMELPHFSRFDCFEVKLTWRLQPHHPISNSYILKLVKFATNLQATVSNQFSFVKIVSIYFIFHYKLFSMVQLTIGDDPLCGTLMALSLGVYKGHSTSMIWYIIFISVQSSGNFLKNLSPKYYSFCRIIMFMLLSVDIY